MIIPSDSWPRTNNLESSRRIAVDKGADLAVSPTDALPRRDLLEPHRHDRGRLWVFHNWQPPSFRLWHLQLAYLLWNDVRLPARAVILHFLGGSQTKDYLSVTAVWVSKCTFNGRRGSWVMVVGCVELLPASSRVLGACSARPGLPACFQHPREAGAACKLPFCDP